MTTGNGQAAVIPDHGPNSIFMGGVADGKITGDRESGDLGGKGAHSLPGLGHVEGPYLLSGSVMPAGDKYNGVLPHHFTESALLKSIGGIADQDQTDRTALPFHDRIGRQCRRQRNKLDILAFGGPEHLPDRFPDSEG